MNGARSRGAAVQAVREALAAAGIDSPALDARLLVAHALAIEPIDLATRSEVLVSAHEQTAIDTLTARRLAFEPVSRIIGERWFHGRPFKLSPATLDPRPDSETLVEAVLAFVDRTSHRQAPLRLLDLGTGTGCLLLTLLAELPAATGIGVDIAAAALETAATNATLNGIAPDRVTWRQGSGFESVDGIFNVILSNPPYIPTKTIEDLAADVRLYDPLAALDGGPDGLDFYRSWSYEAPTKLDKSLGMIVFEVGHGQAAAVATLMATALHVPVESLATHRDLGGVVRCVAHGTR